MIAVAKEKVRRRALPAASLAGAVLGAFLASACCIGPLLLALVGLGGAGLLVRLEAYRPYFTAFTLAALGTGFWLTYRKPRPAEGDACGCAQPAKGRAGKVLLWLATAVTIGFWIFPWVADRLAG